MSNISKTIFALVAVFGGAVASAQAQAATSTVMLSPDNFADRCALEGGDFDAFGGGYSCELQTTQVDCLFDGVYGYCEWEGGPNRREVIRVIGMAAPDSLSGQGLGKKKVKINLPDLDIKLP